MSGSGSIMVQSKKVEWTTSNDSITNILNGTIGLPYQTKLNIVETTVNRFIGENVFRLAFEIRIIRIVRACKNRYI